MWKKSKGWAYNIHDEFMTSKFRWTSSRTWQSFVVFVLGYLLPQNDLSRFYKHLQYSSGCTFNLHFNLNSLSEVLQENVKEREVPGLQNLGRFYWPCDSCQCHDISNAAHKNKFLKKCIIKAVPALNRVCLPSPIFCTQCFLLHVYHTVWCAVGRSMEWDCNPLCCWNSSP